MLHERLEKYESNACTTSDMRPQPKATHTVCNPAYSCACLTPGKIGRACDYAQYKFTIDIDTDGESTYTKMSSLSMI